MSHKSKLVAVGALVALAVCTVLLCDFLKETPVAANQETGAQAAKERARRETIARLFPTTGYREYSKLSDVPLLEWLEPGSWGDAQGVITTAIQLVAAVLGKDDAITQELLGNRSVKAILPMKFPVAIGQGREKIFIDAFWSADLKAIYLSRRADSLMLICSNLVQEAVHARQFPDGARDSGERQIVAAAELEAHRAQMTFNQKLRSFLGQHRGDFDAASLERWLLELDVIDENLRLEMNRYQSGAFPQNHGTLRGG